MQIDELRSYCDRRGWKIVAEYVDTGWSGAKKDRPQFLKLMNAAREHRFSCVLCWKLDRFGRSVANFVEALEQLESWGIRFMCTSQEIDTDSSNPGSRLLLQILAAIAEFERSMIKERVKAGMSAARRRGAKIGRPRLIFDREKIIQLHLRGKSVRAIAADLNVGTGTVMRTLAARSA